MPKIEFFEKILHGYELMSILFDDVSLSLLYIIPYVPDMDRIDIASNQPHLIDINIRISKNLKERRASVKGSAAVASSATGSISAKGKVQEIKPMTNRKNK